MGMRFKSLDGWRGIAALLVALYHLPFLNHLYDSVFLRNSYLFVDFFFVLSGFVIAYAYQNKLNNPSQFFTFMRKRFIRLWPLHFFVLMLFLSFELLKLVLAQTGLWSPETAPFSGEYSIPSLLSNLFLMHSLGIHNTLTWNYPSWSISVEFYTYFVFGLICLASIKLKISITLQYLFLIVLSFFILYNNIDNMNEATYNNGLFRCIPSFLLGTLCYKLFLAKNNIKIPFASAFEVGLIIGIYYFFVSTGGNKYSLLAPFLFALVVYIFSYEQGLISAFLKNNMIQNLGKWSYSIYMLHAFIILMIGRFLKFIEKITDSHFKVDHISSSNITDQLILIENPYVMDLLTLLYLTILVFISSKVYKYVELNGGKLFATSKKIVVTN